MTREISLIDAAGKPLRNEARMLVDAQATPWQGFALEVRAMTGDGENPPCYNPHPLIGLCVRGHVKGAMTRGRRVRAVCSSSSRATRSIAPAGAAMSRK